MRLRKTIPSKIDIPHHPACPNCGKPMWLERIEPHKPDHDQRTFECSECGQSKTEIVKYK